MKGYQMTATRTIPRIGPAADDGSGLGDFAVTYPLDDDERDQLARMAATLDRLRVFDLAASMVRAEENARIVLRRNRERDIALDQLHGRAPFWVACPECDGRAQICDCCHGVGWVSPILANLWDRQGI